MRPRNVIAGSLLVSLIALLGVVAPAPVVGQPSPPATDRISGSNRQQTAVAVAQAAFPGPAPVVYLAEQGSELALALVAASIGDGPVLLVPADGEVDASVVGAIDRADPDRVVAVGDDIPTDRLEDLAGGRQTERASGGDDLSYAADLVTGAPGLNSDTVYLAEPVRLADGLAGGSLDGPVLLVAGDGPVSPAVRGAITTADPTRVVALGGTAAIADAVLTEAAQGRATDRLGGGSRYDTAALIAAAAYPTTAETVFVARADIAPDAVVGGVLPGPLLLVDTCPPGGSPPPVHPATEAAIQRLAPTRLVALGGTAAVCEAVLVDAATPGEALAERVVGAPDYAADRLADPWDFDNQEDVHLDGVTTLGLTNQHLDGGQLAFTSSSGFVHLVWPAMPATALPIGRDGIATPLDGDRYPRVSARVWAAQASPFYIAWSTCPSGLAGSCVETGNTGGSLQAGWQTIDMAPGWSGQVHGVRFGVGFGSDYRLDWARAYTPTGARLGAAEPTGGTVAWDTNADPGDNTPDNPGWGALPAGGLAADAYPPGDYWIHNGDTGATRGPFRIAAPPQVRVLDPDLAGGADYATTVTGDPWDFDQISDVAVVGNATVELVDGVLRAVNANGTGDPFLLMRTGGAIDPNRYHRVTVEYTVTPPLDLSFNPGGGTHARVLFGPAAPGAYSNGAELVAYPNERSYTFDMNQAHTVATGPAWAAGPIDRLRFDPNEDPAAGRTWTVSSLAIRADDESPGSFDLQWEDTTAPGLAEPTRVTWYADTNTDGRDGTLIVAGLDQQPGENTYRWDTCALPPGTYWPYLEADRNGARTVAVASGPLQVTNTAC